jgi:tRNA(Ile)-lysidine synthetase-like protein
MPARETRHFAVAIQWGQTAILPFKAGAVRLEPAGYADRPVTGLQADNSECALLKAEELQVGGHCASGLVVRNWEPGDSYTPVGHSGPLKIKELFQKHRVYLWQRPHWPVLELGGRILWSRLFGPSADLIAGKCDGAVARLTYYKKAPLGIQTQERAAGSPTEHESKAIDSTS